MATQSAPNVAHTIGSSFGFTDIVQSIQLPMKIIWGNHILGLGDIVSFFLDGIPCRMREIIILVSGFFFGVNCGDGVVGCFF